MQEKRGILGGEKNNMVKSQPKKGCKYYEYIDNQIKKWKEEKNPFYELSKIWKKTREFYENKSKL